MNLGGASEASDDHLLDALLVEDPLVVEIRVAHALLHWDHEGPEVLHAGLPWVSLNNRYATGPRNLAQAAAT